MIQKVHAIVLIAVGILLVIALMIMGRGVLDTSHYGRRMRRLVQMGVTALICSGVPISVPGCESYDVTDQVGIIEVEEKGSVAKSPAWRRFMRVWSEASSIANGEKGNYPYTKDEREILMKALKRSHEDADSFVQDSVFGQPEGELFKLAVNEMIEDAGKFRTVEMKGATCYLPMMHIQGEQSAKRLSSRIQFLKQLAGTKRVQGVVLEIVLSTMEDEIAELEALGDRHIRGLEEGQTAVSIAAEVRKAIGEIQTKFESEDTEQTDEQQTP